MHLKNIQIVGFKSFADRIKLDFEPGLVAVVGPNGCGKSNIIDAFRWCLGEMSAKSLRSSLMLDVVFNGSGKRPPSNMAEVTLTFDNNDKRLPINFSDVSITRRLFRSGESEYYINKTQCRLRDIRELFLDTGMGEDGYSSMEQGKVEWILQAKPEQRRELFEEAAGVSKYRARREEAVRKLDRVEIDLSRINDIVAVTKDQIRKLENAVTRAKNFERIKSELREIEIGDWLFQLSKIKMELSQQKSGLDDKQKEHDILTTETHQLEASLAEWRRRLAGTEEKLLDANGVLSAIDADIKIGEERKTNAVNRISELQNQMSSIHTQIEREKSLITQLTSQSDQQKAALVQFQTDGQDIEKTYEASKSACEKALADLELKSTEIKASRDKILARARDRAECQKEIGQKTSDVSRSESQLENLEKDLLRLKNDKSQLVLSIEESSLKEDELRKQGEEKKIYLTAIDQDIETQQSKESTLDDQILSHAESIAKLKGRIHSIEEQQEEDPYLSGTKALLDAGLPGLLGPLGTLIQSDPGDRDILSASLGEHLGDLIALTQEEAQTAIDYLSDQQKGRSRIWILDKIPARPRFDGDQNVPATSWIANRVQSEDRIKPLISYLTSHSWVEGGTIYSPAVINGGVDPSKWKTHVTLRLPELNQQLLGMEEKKQTLDNERSDLHQNLAERIQSRESVLKELEELKVRLEMKQVEIEKSRSSLNICEGKTSECQSQREQLLTTKQHAQQDLHNKQNLFDGLHQKDQEDHEKLDIMQYELTELQNAHSKANADLSLKAEQHNSYQEKLSWHQSVLNHTESEIEKVRNNLTHHEQNIDNMKVEIQKSVQAQEEAKTLIETSLTKRIEADNVCSDIQSDRGKISIEIDEAERVLSDLRGQMSSLQEEIQNSKIEEASLKGRQNTLMQKLREQYELTEEKAQNQINEKEADPDLLEKLKKRVANTGPINLAAPQEHAELVEKNLFLESQQSDLVKAKDDLKQVISKINATTKEHFKSTFEQVRENFRALYAQLFRGGDADLRLTNEEDILSSGIDIYCQPPGKKLLHISLLSGGEKALTACALLFAFFQVRPSPVALLDEVDAPLDEANVLRFVEMISAFAEKTQFLIITHNKRTMESANNLYGVTMEEMGVSRVLSARLAKASEGKESPAETEPAAL